VSDKKPVTFKGSRIVEIFMRPDNNTVLIKNEAGDTLVLKVTKCTVRATLRALEAYEKKRVG